MNSKEFEQILTQYQEIKINRVDERLNFYKDRVESKRHFAERSKAAVLLLSLVIPVVANLDFILPLDDIAPWKGIVISILSLSIAFIGGFSEIHQWQRAWREYSKAIVQIERLIGLWEINVAKARQLSDPKEISDRLAKTTDSLLASVEQIVLTEMQVFFTPIPRTPSDGNESGTL